MSVHLGDFNEYGRLGKVAIRGPSQAMASDAKIDGEWRALNWHSRPDLGAARREFETFASILRRAGAELIELPAEGSLTLDSLYARDALVVTPRGLVFPRMGKEARRRETEVNGEALADLGLPLAGRISGSGTLEGGDLVWLDRHTLLAGVGYRTNLEGVRQLQVLAGPDVRVEWFDMPHFKGTADVFHLMSCLSPLDRDLALVYRPLLAARLVEFLEARGIAFVDVPDEEFPTMGVNVLALGPRHAVMVEGNPETARRMAKAGVQVEIIAGEHLCRKGEGGPTCLTRPLTRG
ncbi:MAG: amidinotransferase [Alphaproteobacteria bacterium]|nr:amidinotransferase [Alphaproteobacteria bacterium]